MNRRAFLKSTGAAVALPAFSATRPAKYRRHNVMSKEGKAALASYAKGVEAMLALKPDHPHNWFRNAFVHFMDCPHGNWWFYVWHRGYVGYFEQTIRALSKDPTFAIPYWDWTTYPEIPDGMFTGALDPTSDHYLPFTRDLDTFFAYIKPPLTAYWNSLNKDQLAQLQIRGLNSLDDLWAAVALPDDAGDRPFAPTKIARWYTRANHKLDENSAKNVAAPVVRGGLAAKYFYDGAGKVNSFNSFKTASHHTAPGGTGSFFSIIEGQPHNIVHNSIGGAGHIDPGPYGNMTNNLSPVDPIFFLHHGNMDRLWDVWTRKQQRQGKPYLPADADAKPYNDEEFLFYFDANGKPVPPTRAGDLTGMERWDYDYQPGFGEDQVAPARPMTLTSSAPITATLRGQAAAANVSAQALQQHLRANMPPVLFAEITVDRPAKPAGQLFQVLVGAPANMTHATADSPFFAGTISFFGHSAAHGGHMGGDNATQTFLIPLPQQAAVFQPSGNTAGVNIRVVAANSATAAPVVRSVAIRTRS
jgi:tyrosinase